MVYNVLTVRPSNLEEMTTRFRAATRKMRDIAAREWGADQDFPLGYLLVQDDTSPVGQLLCLYRARDFQGTAWVSANMSTWFVAPEHRGAGLGLLIAMHRDISRHDAFATVLAPGGKARTIYLALRYAQLPRDRLSCQIAGGPVSPVEIETWFDPVTPEDTPFGHAGLMSRFDTDHGALFVKASDQNGISVLNVLGVSDALKNAPPLYQALDQLRASVAGRGTFELRLETGMILGTLPPAPIVEQGWGAGQTRLDRMCKGPRPPLGALDFLYSEAVLFGSPML